MKKLQDNFQCKVEKEEDLYDDLYDKKLTWTNNGVQFYAMNMNLNRAKKIIEALEKAYDLDVKEFYELVFEYRGFTIEYVINTGRESDHWFISHPDWDFAGVQGKVRFHTMKDAQNHIDFLFNSYGK